MKQKGFLAGIVIGAVVFGATPAIASGIIAELSSQTIFVDGAHVPMTAYNINGNNYVRLRDIGEAVDFGVSYDAATNTVQIDSDAPYAEEVLTETRGAQTVAEMVTQTFVTYHEERDKNIYDITVENSTHPGKLSTGEEANSENINRLLGEFAVLYPEGTSWGASYNDGDLYRYDNHTACNSYAYLLHDVLYGVGSEPTRIHNDLSEVRIGDVVYLKSNANDVGHWIVVSSDLVLDTIGEPAYYFETMEANVSAAISIDARYLEATQLDYPESTVFCYY